MKVNLFEYQLQRLAFSIIITVLFAVIFIKSGYEYKIDVHQKIPSSGTSDHFYFDLNNDGKSEKILKYNPSSNRTSIIVYNPDARIIGQYNLYGNCPPKSFVYSLDYDHTGQNKIIVFTYSSDSLFINIIDPRGDDARSVRSGFIDIAPLEDGKANYVIRGGISDDANNDGYLETYFSVNAGFALIPRNVYFYDIHNEIVRKSPQSGTSPRYILEAADIDNDGHIELWGDNVASGNYKSPVPYTDHEAWFMVFTHTLGFRFDPVGFPEFPARVIPLLLSTGRDKIFAVTYQYTGTVDSLHNKILLYTTDGRFLKSKDLEEYGLTGIENCFVSGDAITLHDNNGNLITFDKDLNVTRQIRQARLAGLLTGPYNLTGEKRRILLLSRDNSLYFYNEKGEMISGTVLENTGNSVAPPELVNSYNGFTGFQLKTDNFRYLLTITKRHVWLVFIIKIASLFLLVYLMVFFIQYIQIVQLEKRNRYESKLREYQLIAVKNQISPHFIFNALTSISSMYLNNDPKSANDFMISFSRLMENVVESSDKVIVDIATEAELLEKYLKIEKVRLGKEFKYSLHIPDDCKNIKIPSMSLHSFVENSVKHGLAHKKGPKQLDINAVRDRKSVKVVVEDNGPGLHSKNDNVVSTGKGLVLISQMFSTFKHITGKDISYHFEEKETGGLRAIITINRE